MFDLNPILFISTNLKFLWIFFMKVILKFKIFL
jgi:hypothetical protein